MSCRVWRVARTGSAIRVDPVACDAEGIGDATPCLPPHGIYAGFATIHGLRVVCLSKHLDRLYDSARRVGFEFDIDRILVGHEIAEAIRRSGFTEAKMRVAAAPGDDCLTIAMEPYSGYPAEQRMHGVACATVGHTARSNPLAKQTGWLSTRESFARSTTHDVFEYLLLDDDEHVLEGSSSSFFAVTGQPQALRTAGDQVLAGIARSIVLEVAPAVIDIDLTPVTKVELPEVGEAFITSATRGVIPVVQIDGAFVGDGAPGTVTREIMGLFDRRAIQLEEPLEA